MSSFEDLLTAGEIEPVFAHVEGLPPAARSKAFDVALACCNRWFVGGDAPRPGSTYFQWVWQSEEGQRECASLAALVLGTADQLATRLPDRAKGSVSYGEPALPALERFKPSWLKDAGLDLITQAGKLSFPLVVLLRERGLCRQPRSDWYVLALIEAARRWRHKDQTFLDWLDERPTVLREDVRLVFGIEGSGECSLAALDKYGGSWATTLMALSERGDLPRAELLDLTLEVLGRDYAAFRAGWFSRFHESLKPTQDERVARLAAYERLLGAMTPQTAAWALKALEVVAKKKRLNARTFLSAVEPMLSAPAKGTVQSALRISSGLLKQDASLAHRVANLCLLALIHPEAAVQKDALALFRAAGGEDDPELAGRLADAAPALAATVRRELGPGGPPSPPVTSSAATPATGWAASDPLSPSQALMPPPTLSEALDVIAKALEHPNDVALYESALDGISRFNPRDHEGFEKLAGPVTKRTLALVARGNHEHILGVELTRAALAWSTGKRIKNPFERFDSVSGPKRFFYARTNALLERLKAHQHGPLLSTPTHRYGYIELQAFERRLAQREGIIDLPDAVLALHRLGPQADRGVVARLEARVADPAPLRRAAEQLAADRLMIGAFRFGTEPHIFYRLRAVADPDASPSTPYCLAEHLVDCVVREQDLGGLRDWLLWALPYASEWTASAEATGIGGYGFDEPSSKDVLRGWDDPSITHGTNGHLTLAAALGARAASLHLSARDAIIEHLASGRLRPEELGAAFANLLPGGLIKAARWAKELAEIATVSAQHANQVRVAILASLRGDPELSPRDIGKLLELCLELHVQLGARCDDPMARHWLEACGRGGAVKKAAKGMLAL